LTKRGRTSNLEPWRRSVRFSQIARQSAKANHAKFRVARCGAARKRDGAPCRNPAMKNGRCDIHGGKTPRGLQWHIVQYPDGSEPADEKKFNRKVRQQQRHVAKRAVRLAAMTPEQRARHHAWHRSHAPGGSKASRNARRVRARQNAQALAVVSSGASQRLSDPETVRIERLLASAKARLALLEARTAKPGDNNEGVFA
jgi:hypothetical protein